MRTRFGQQKTALRLVQAAKRRTADIEFVQYDIPESLFDLNRGRIMVLKTLINVELREGLLGTYGSWHKSALAPFD